MTKKNLYRYLGKNGIITSLVLLEGIDHIAMYRIFADEGKLLTNGETITKAIDIFAEDIDNWKEVEDNSN